MYLLLTCVHCLLRSNVLHAANFKCVLILGIGGAVCFSNLGRTRTRSHFCFFCKISKLDLFLFFLQLRLVSNIRSKCRTYRFFNSCFGLNGLFAEFSSDTGEKLGKIERFFKWVFRFCFFFCFSKWIWNLFGFPLLVLVSMHILCEIFLRSLRKNLTYFRNFQK